MVKGDWIKPGATVIDVGMNRNAEGKLAMTLVTLRPVVTFFGEKRPSATEHQALHHEAHEECYIASSVKTEVRCEPVALTA